MQYFFYDNLGDKSLWNETFEQGNLLTAGTTANFIRDSSAAYQDTNGIRRDTSAVAFYQTWNPVVVKPGVKITAFLRTNSDFVTAGLPALCFGIPAAGGTRGYQFVLDNRNATGTPGMQLRKDFSTTYLSSRLQAITVNTWYRVEVTWTTSTISAALFTATGTTALGTITSTDSTYRAAGGFVGVGAYSSSSFDSLRIAKL